MFISLCHGWTDGRTDKVETRESKLESAKTAVDLYEAAHVGKVLVHSAAVREVGRHSLHQVTEASVRLRFCTNHRPF